MQWLAQKADQSSRGSVPTSVVARAMIRSSLNKEWEVADAKSGGSAEKRGESRGGCVCRRCRRGGHPVEQILAFLLLPRLASSLLCCKNIWLCAGNQSVEGVDKDGPPLPPLASHHGGVGGDVADSGGGQGVVEEDT